MKKINKIWQHLKVITENLAIYITAFFVVITAGELLIKYVIWPYLQLIWKNL